MSRSRRNSVRLRQVLSIAIMVALVAGAALIRPANAGPQTNLAIHAQNNLDRQVYILCRVKPKSMSTTIGMTVEPGHQVRMTFQPVPLGDDIATMHCGAFESVAGGKGTPVFPHAGAGGMSPVGVAPLPQGGTRAVTYVAKQPSPHYEGIQ